MDDTESFYFSLSCNALLPPWVLLLLLRYPHHSHYSNSCRRVDREIILDLMRVLDGCGSCVVGYLVGGENSDQVFTLFKAVELFLDVAVIIFTFNRQ